MRTLNNVVSSFPNSNFQSLPEQRHIKACPIGSLKLWAALGGRSLSLHQWRPTATASELLRSQLNQSKEMKRPQKRSRRSLWKAELAQDAPFIIAIGACIFSSFALVQENSEEIKSSEGSVDNYDPGANDIRYGAMTIISFIPLFNWLGWVFAWLDTDEKRYLFFAIVYLAPYLRSGFALSPDESWLPIASIIACIVHVQVEINLNTGVEMGQEFIRDAVKQVYPKVMLPKLWGQGKRFTEPLPPEPDEQQLMTEEEFGRQELIEFDKKLSNLENMREENKLGKSYQVETDNKTYDPEKLDD